MRKRSRASLAASCLVLSGCLTHFKHPLGPAEEGFIDPKLVGTWSCTSADDPTPATLTIIDFDATRYYMESVEAGKTKRSRLRAHATRVEGEPFLSVRELGQEELGDWSILAYGVTDSQLKLRLVDPKPFEDVLDDAIAVRERLATLLQDPEVIEGFIECTRSKDGE